MKIRMDFVTNSSSSSYVLELSLIPVEGEAQSCEISVSPEGSWGADGSFSASDICLKPEEEDGKALFSGRSVRSAANIRELCDLLFGSAVVYGFEPETDDENGSIDDETVSGMLLNARQTEAMKKATGNTMSTYAEALEFINQRFLEGEDVSHALSLIYVHQLAGKTLSVNGQFRWYESRDELVDDILLSGGCVADSVGEKVDLMILGGDEYEAEIAERAAKLGIPVIDELEYMRRYDDEKYYDCVSEDGPFEKAVRDAFPRTISDYVRSCEEREIGPGNLEKIIIRNKRTGYGDSAMFISEDEPHLMQYRDRYTQAAPDDKQAIVQEMVDFIKGSPVLEVNDNEGEMPDELPCIWTGTDEQLEAAAVKYLEGEAPDSDWIGAYVEIYTVNMNDESMTRKEALCFPE